MGYSYTTIKCLPDLNGRIYDDIALSYISALRPSKLRVIQGNEMIQDDAMPWRVTVFLSKEGTINYIQQEVKVELPPDIANGLALRMALTYGRDSENFRSCNNTEPLFIFNTKAVQTGRH